MRVVLEGNEFDVFLDGDMFVVATDGEERGRIFVGELSRPPGPVYVVPDPEPETEQA